MQGLNAVTTLQHFGLDDERPLFQVNPGVPVQQALERASQLVSCIGAMAASRGIADPALEARVMRYLIEAARATLRSCISKNTTH